MEKQRPLYMEGALDQSLGHWIQRLAGQAHWAYEQRLAPLGVSAAQAAVLRLIASGKNKPGEIAEALDVDPAAITRLLDRLAEKDLIARCDASIKDRRCVGLSLSPAAEALLPRLLAATGKMEAELGSGLSKAERDKLLAQVKALYKKAKDLGPE